MVQFEEKADDDDVDGEIPIATSSAGKSIIINLCFVRFSKERSTCGANS